MAPTTTMRGRDTSIAEHSRSAIDTALAGIRLITETDPERRRAEVEQLFSPDFRASGSGSDFCPHHAARQLHPADYDAFADPSVEIRSVSVSGDRVIAQIGFRGTHVGEFQGRPPTGQVMRADGLYVLRVVQGRIQEAWSVLRWQ